MISRLRSHLTTVGVAAALTASLCGGAVWADQLVNQGTPLPLSIAQTAATTTTSTAASTVATTAAKTATLTPRQTAQKAALDVLVQNGTLTQAQENAVIGALRQAAVNQIKPVLHQLLADMAASIEQTLHLTPQQLRQQRQLGQSIAQIAQAQGVPLATVTSNIDAAAKQSLDAQVSGNHITAAQEQRILTALDKRLPAILNRTPKTRATKTTTSTATTAAPTTTTPVTN